MLLYLALEDEPTPEQPEALGIIRESRILGIPYFQCGIYDLPHLFRLEMRTVIEAENEYHEYKALMDAIKAHNNANQPAAG